MNIYDKINANMVKKIQVKNNKKFSIIDDILRFIKSYNSKYNSNIDVNILLQSNEEEKDIINKVCKFILEFFFDIDENDEYEDENDKGLEFKNFDGIEEGYFNSNPNNENSQNILTFDEFYPIKKSFDINKKKRKYNEIVDLENELLNFWGGINASKRLKK